MAKDLVIGIDASTMACKAVVWDIEGKEVAAGRAEILLIRPRQGRHEQKGQDVYRAMAKTLRIAVSNVEAWRF